MTNNELTSTATDMIAEYRAMTVTYADTMTRDDVDTFIADVETLRFDSAIDFSVCRTLALLAARA